MTGEETTIAWEVWRTHARGGPDVRVGHGLSRARADRFLAECIGDDDLRDFCDFYLVRATTTRERVQP